MSKVITHKATKIADEGEETAETNEAPPPGGPGKAVVLLKNMSVEIKEEIKEDSAAHKNMTEWCDSTIKATASAVKAAYAKDEELVNKITIAASKKAKMEVELEELGKSVADSSTSLQEAEAIRKRQHETFE